MDALPARFRTLSVQCLQWFAKLAGGIDRELRKTAGEGNEIIYRFLQVLLYVGVPILLLILVSIMLAR